MPTRPPAFVDDKLAGESPTMANLDTMNLATPLTMINASAKPLREMLGEILKPTRGSGLPARLRLTSYSPEADKVMLHGIGKDVRPVESTIAEFNKLHDGGALMREGPPTEGLSVPALIKRLLALVGETPGP